MTDQNSATLLEVLDRLPGGLYDWVVEQTLAALYGRLRPTEAGAEVEAVIGRDDGEILADGPTLAEVRGLLFELVRLVHASDVVAARLGLDGAGSEQSAQTALQRVWSSAA